MHDQIKPTEHASDLFIAQGAIKSGRNYNQIRFKLRISKKEMQISLVCQRNLPLDSQKPHHSPPKRSPNQVGTRICKFVNKESSRVISSRVTLGKEFRIFRAIFV
jgi:hypothetical protein